MAGVLNMRDVILFDLWPGTPDPNLSCPTEGFDASTQCSSTPVWPLGTKIQTYNDSTYGPGYFTMIYLQFVEASGAAQDVGDISDGYNCCAHVLDVCANLPGTTVEYWYMVTNCLTDSDGTKGAPIAFPVYDLSGMEGTTGQNECGWFWCGGVNPCITTSATNTADCTRMAAEMLTDGNITQGMQMAIDGGGATTCFAPYVAAASLQKAVGLALVADV